MIKAIEILSNYDNLVEELLKPDAIVGFVSSTVLESSGKVEPSRYGIIPTKSRFSPYKLTGFQIIDNRGYIVNFGEDKRPLSPWGMIQYLKSHKEVKFDLIDSFGNIHDLYCWLLNIKKADSND